MKSTYHDIQSRIKDKPKWYDKNGVPRYGEFHPSLCSHFHADELILLKIHCQYCNVIFLVELNMMKDDNVSYEYRFLHYHEFYMLPFHYGDPPRHDDCTGNSMNSIPIEIIQFWKRENVKWIRKTEYEQILSEIKPSNN